MQQSSLISSRIILKVVIIDTQKKEEFNWKCVDKPLRTLSWKGWTTQTKRHSA